MAQLNDRLFSRDPVSKSWETFHYDPATDKFVIAHQQDVAELVAQNKREFNATEKRTPYREWSKVASIPLTVMEDLRKRGILYDEKAFRAWLNDPDQRAFRTRTGKV